MSRISRHKTIAGTPQKNSLDERFNRTILKRVRCMLVNIVLNKVFWVEVVVNAAYLIKRYTLTYFGMMTPEEVWLDHPLNLD